MLEKKNVQNINQGLDFLVDKMNNANIKYINEKPIKRSEQELLKIAKKHVEQNLYSPSFVD